VRPATPVALRIEFLVVLLLLSIYAYFHAPFSFGDKRVSAPAVGISDSIHQSLMVAASVDKLLTDPRSFYDTAILYPDRNQLRTTEPFIGYALIGLPLKVALPLNDTDLFEAVRWVVVFICLIYAYVLFRALGIDVAVAAAGAVLCLSQPALLNEIGRLNNVCIPLIFPVLYYCLMVWTSGLVRDSVGLFVFAALYPLCGMINVTIALMALVFALPLHLKVLAALTRQGRLALFVVPLVLAALLDALMVAPWLLDRSDLAVYVSDAFLEIKHWNPMRGPEHVANLYAFVLWSLGPAVAAALIMLGLAVVLQRADRSVRDAASESRLPPPSQMYLSAVCVVAAGVDIGVSSHPGGPAAWLPLAFQLVCYLTLFLYWRHQIRFLVSTDQSGIRNYVLMLTAGVGVFACLMSFGPVYISNPSPLANQIMSVLLHVLPPLKAIREFHRIWIFGVLFLSIYLTVRLGIAARVSTTSRRVAVAGVIVAAALTSVYNRQLVASPNIEPPRDLFELASHSRAGGGIYVHPGMQWNTSLGVWAIPLARVLGRPIVNGYLGIAPPWFDYAGRVLHRFPDAQSVWLLRKWNVDTVVSVAGDLGADLSGAAQKIFANATGVVYDIRPSPQEITHPSKGNCVAGERDVRIEAELSRKEIAEGGMAFTVTAPPGFAVQRVEVSFRQSVVEQLPESIGVYALDSSVRLNDNQSGDWIESLAADALLQRKAPVATIRLKTPQRGNLRVEFQKSEKPPLARMALCGDWTR